MRFFAVVNPGGFLDAVFPEKRKQWRNGENGQQKCGEKRAARSEGDIFEQAERTEKFAEVVKIIEHGNLPRKKEILIG